MRRDAPSLRYNGASNLRAARLRLGKPTSALHDYGLASQPPRCATTAWQVRRERRTATARHPYLLERDALRVARSTESCGGFVVWRPRHLHYQQQVVLCATLTNECCKFSVAPARETDHANANECCQFSVSPVFSRASAGVRSRLAGIGVQKSEMEASSLAEVFFFESHIRSTNAPARRISILLIMLILSKNPLN